MAVTEFRKRLLGSMNYDSSACLSEWYVEDGDFVKKDQKIARLESADYYLEETSDYNGIIKVRKEKGDCIIKNEVFYSIFYLE